MVHLLSCPHAASVVHGMERTFELRSQLEKPSTFSISVPNYPFPAHFFFLLHNQMPSIKPRASSTNPSALFTPSSQVLALYSSAKGGTSTCPGTKLDTYGPGYDDNGSSNVKTHYCATGSGAGMVGYW